MPYELQGSTFGDHGSTKQALDTVGRLGELAARLRVMHLDSCTKGSPGKALAARRAELPASAQPGAHALPCNPNIGCFILQRLKVWKIVTNLHVQCYRTLMSMMWHPNMVCQPQLLMKTNVTKSLQCTIPVLYYR